MGAPFDKLVRRAFVCPSCSALRLLRRSTNSPKRIKLDRHASTSSSTAVNATRPIPPAYQTLHKSLAKLEREAQEHVNLSRLRLALQGLESDNPTVRIAFLGLDTHSTARRIVRLLLADALVNEELWENQIAERGSSNGLLIRYGQLQHSNIPQNSALPILQVPSPLLEKLNIELLVSAINSEHGNDVKVPPDALLSPAVGTPTAFDGREVTINQPVHRSVLVTDGFEQLVAAIKLLSMTSFQSPEQREAITMVANLPGNALSPQGRILVSDAAQAEKGLQAIRRSTSEASTYGRDWSASGLPQISSWLETASGFRLEPGRLKSPVTNLVSSILTSTQNSIQASGALAAKIAASQGLNTSSRNILESAIEDFSRRAHQELQSGLASAWSSRNWRKLAWYKLFWRVDDVDLIVTDLVVNAWLPRTERAVYELSGRLSQVGILPIMAELHTPRAEPSPAIETLAAPVLETPMILASATSITTAPVTHPVITNESGTPTVQIRPSPAPVPIASAISNARNAYIAATTSSLTNTAQQLVFRTLSISGLSAGLSALVYVSQLSSTMYEAGTIFAVGSIFALYRMQGGWQMATKIMEEGLFEEGKAVIKGIVGRMKTLVDSRVEVREDVIEKERREKALIAVDNARGQLTKLEGDSKVSQKG